MFVLQRGYSPSPVFHTPRKVVDFFSDELELEFLLASNYPQSLSIQNEFIGVHCFNVYLLNATET